MPRPLYLICSKSGSEDKQTGLLSMYHVLERLALAPQEPDRPRPPFSFRIVSAWLREEGDDKEQEYEFSVLLHFPSEDQGREVAKDSFYLTHPIYRIVINAQLGGCDGPGILTVESRIRPVGTEDWVVQAFPILVEIASKADEGALADD